MLGPAAIAGGLDLAVLAIAPLSELAIASCAGRMRGIDSVPDCFNNAQRDRTTRALVARVLRGCPPRIARCDLISVSRSLRFYRLPPRLSFCVACGCAGCVKNCEDRLQTFTDPSLTCPELCLTWSRRRLERPLSKTQPQSVSSRARKRYSCF